MRLVTGALAALLLAVTLDGAVTGCEVDAPGCTPTTMKAEDAVKVDLTKPSSSSVLRARLTTSKGKPLVGQPVTLTLRRADSDLYSVDTRADKQGDIAYDLKGLNPQQLVAAARADTFSASFDGDGTYCSADDDARFHATKGGVGLP